MAFQVSPGINVSEVDLTTSVPSLSTSIGAFAGQFSWGPIDEVTTISDEVKLVDVFGKPDSNTYRNWFSAANFLAYSNNLKVVRTSNTSTKNASTVAGVLIKNKTDFEQSYNSGATTYGSFAARYAGALGNSLSVSVCPNANAWSQNVSSAAASVVALAVSAGNTSFATAADLTTYIKVGDLVSLTAGAVTTDYTSVTAITANLVTVSPAISDSVVANSSINRRWKYYNEFSDTPATSDYVTERNGSNDELHIVVVDNLGVITGVGGNVLEKFGFVSKASDAKNADGTSNYYKQTINNKSKYLWSLSHPSVSNTTSWGSTSTSTTFIDSTAIKTSEYTALTGGADGNCTSGEILTGYSKFSNPEVSDISLLISGAADLTIASGLISLVEGRKDTVLFLSPLESDVVDNSGSELADVLLYRNSLTSTSYAVMDSSWKYQYDKYNDVYRWVPLNGDIAGLSARTDYERDPWYSPAGANRGIIKNVIKLSWSADKASRDDLYLKGINPVVTFPGEGTMLYGDKTLLSRPSAFDHVNVRRLFIVLEKMVAKAARSSLFEFNDQFTRAQFTALVEPFLRDVQGRRGIFDFRVVCDDTNNTPEVIDRNEFVGDIYIKPTRSINYIQLTFTAVRTGVAFSEIVGRS